MNGSVIQNTSATEFSLWSSAGATEHRQLEENFMPKRRKRTGRIASALTIVRQARAAAKSALESLRDEIRNTTTKLANLVAEEKSFRLDLFGTPTRRGSRGPGRPRKALGKRPTAPRRARRKGAPRAEKFFRRLGNTFTLEDVRKIAGRKAGISLAQWSRAKRIRKAGKGYQKIPA
jgi:hypothetical protein